MDKNELFELLDALSALTPPQNNQKTAPPQKSGGNQDPLEKVPENTLGGTPNEALGAFLARHETAVKKARR